MPPRDPDGSQSEDRPGVGSHPARDSSVAEQDVEATLLSVVDEGRRRMSRPLLPLLSTGAVGGIDVGTGVLALLLVEHATHDTLLGGLAFSIGFIALALARSELFTEDFLVPVSTVIARQARMRMLLRLWAGTLVANMAGGWIFTWFIMKGYPQMAKSAVEAGYHYVQLGFGLRAFSLAVLGGTVITLMTWMQRGAASQFAKVIPAVTAGFLLGGGQLDHAIVNSLLMFAALHTGHAPFGYLDWAKTAGFAAFGNIVGGIGLVTLLRLLQAPHKMAEERANPAPGVPIGDRRRVER
ncbi:MAG TPA: formate/nitrite transporter family protein [Acidimicrobiales bacterium]|jgi:formate/nitrite transporter FocA (FNT family)|nr:formate/nitrite transporter family protein [Acidimicrobiales bacterium]